MKVLIVGDHTTHAHLEMALRTEGILSDLAEDAEDAASILAHAPYDALLVAGEPEDATETETVIATRRVSRTPIVVVSHRASRDLIAHTINSGADDYLVAPYHKDELVARIRAVVRRALGSPSSTLTCGPIMLSLDKHTVHVGRQRVSLTGKEFTILQTLMLRQESCVRKETFLDKLYSSEAEEAEIKIIDVFVCKIRKKLREAGAPGHVQTIWGQGYTIREVPADKEHHRDLAKFTDMRSRILELLDNGTSLYTAEIAQRLEKDMPTVRAALSVLQQRRRIVGEQARGSGRAKIWRAASPRTA